MQALPVLVCFRELLGLPDVATMPDRGRPSKYVRQLLRAQHMRHQETTSGMLMASANVMAHASRALKPMDDDQMAALALEAEREASPCTRGDRSLEDLAANATSGDRSLEDLAASTTQKQSLTSVYNAAKGASTITKKRDDRRHRQ